LDLPAGSYRLVVKVTVGQEKVESSVPVGVMPETFTGPDRNMKRFNGYGMMYVGPGNVEAFRRIKEGGFDWVVPDIQWQDLEPQPGVYNWAPIDQYLQTARETGMKIIVKTLLFSGISWFPKDQFTNNRLVPSNFSREFSDRYSSMWRALTDRYKNEPLIFGWCPTIGHQDNPVGYLDSDETPGLRAAWRAYLKQNGWSLERVAQAVDQTVTSWDQVTPPTLKYLSVHGANDYFRLFTRLRREQAVTVYSQICQAIRSQDSQRPIMLKMGLPWPLDVYDAPNGLWPTGWIKMCKQYNALLVHSNFEDSVAAAILPALAEWYGVHMMIEEGKTPPSPPTSIASVGHGAQYDTLGMEYCFWPEGRRLADWSRIKPVVYRIREFDRIYDNLCVGSFQDELFAGPQNWPELARFYVRFYDLLTKLGYQYRVTDAENISRIPQGVVLLDANCTRLNNDIRDRIDAFVRNGGTYVGQFLTDRDENHALYARWNIKMTPHTAGKVVLSESARSCLVADGFCPQSKDATALLYWQGKEPAAICKKIGKGTVVVLGCGFDSDLPSSATMLQSILTRVGVKPHLSFKPYGAVEVALKQKGDRYQITLLNKAPLSQKITLRLTGIPTVESARDWLDGVDIPIENNIVTIQSEPFELRPIELKIKPNKPIAN